jgi:hypothetical protein
MRFSDQPGLCILTAVADLEENVARCMMAGFKPCGGVVLHYTPSDKTSNGKHMAIACQAMVQGNMEHVCMPTETQNEGLASW